MVKFNVSIAKSSQGEILVNGTYVSGAEPIWIERVVLVELDSQGNAIGSWTHPADMNIDPVQGSYLLFSKMPSGSNVKAARATAHYVEIDKTAKSTAFNL